MLFIFAAITFTAFTAFAQQIQGDVRYADTQRPAYGVLVRCNGSGGNSEQSTTSTGKFYFRVSPGHYDVTVSFPGYKDEQKSVEMLTTMASEYMSFRLRPDSSGANTTHASTVNAAVPSEAQKEFDKGEQALASDNKGALEEGVRHLEKAVAIYPQFVQAHLRLGTAYMDLRQWDKAEHALKKTLEIDPNAVNALFALGEIYLGQKKDEDAEKVLLQGLQIEDRSFQGHLTLARVYWDMALKIKDEAQARPSLEKAYDQVNQTLKLNPDLAQAHLVKGNLLLRVRRAADAQHEFEEYLRLDPKGPFAADATSMIQKIKQALAQSEKK